MRKFFEILAGIGVGVFLCLATCAVLLFVWSSRAESEWSPAWSSNQQHIAFECEFFRLSDLLDEEYSYFGKSDICVFNRDDKEATRLTAERGMWAPTWSPDGTMLAWIKGDSIAIWDMSVNQFQYFQSERHERQSLVLDGPLEWSDDGQKIFVQGDGAVFDVEQKVFLDPLSMYRSLDNCCFNWSSDGKYVAYQHVFLEDSSGNHLQVVIMQNDQTIFTSDLEVGREDPLRWSPDSSILAWPASIHSKTATSRYQLALTDVASHSTTFLTFGNGFVGILGIAWSPSGNQIAARQGDELQIVDLGSGVTLKSDETVQIQSMYLHGSSFEGLSWSPDEQFIAYETNWEPYSRIWILEPSSNVQIPLVSRFGD